MLLKIDIAKVFDFVNQYVLLDIMEMIGSGTTQRKWIKGYLKFGRTSILVKGLSSGELAISRGVCHGEALGNQEISS